MALQKSLFLIVAKTDKPNTMTINTPTYEVVFNKDKSDVKSISLTSKPLFDNFIIIDDE